MNPGDKADFYVCGDCGGNFRNALEYRWHLCGGEVNPGDKAPAKRELKENDGELKAIPDAPVKPDLPAERGIEELQTLRDTNSEKLDILRAERDEARMKANELGDEVRRLLERNKNLEASLWNRHIIGKVYEVSAESINQLAGELDEANKEIAKLRGELELRRL